LTVQELRDYLATCEAEASVHALQPGFKGHPCNERAKPVGALLTDPNDIHSVYLLLGWPEAEEPETEEAKDLRW
jgi:hypothetical protein